MKALFTSMLQALAQGEGVVLCSILASSGSTPRGAGAKMAVFADGHTEGTVGGGAVELESGKLAMEVLKTKQSLVHGYCLALNEVADIGMICGGNVTVFFQYFDPQAEADTALLRGILELLNGNQNSWLVYRMDDGCVSAMGTYDEAHGLRFTDCITLGELRPMLCADAVTKKGEPRYYVEPLTRAGYAYIFGGGHVGAALVPVLASVDFRVVVYDNRPGFATPEHYPQAERVILGDYLDIGAHLTLTENDYVCIMTPAIRPTARCCCRRCVRPRRISAASAAAIKLRRPTSISWKTASRRRSLPAFTRPSGWTFSARLRRRLPCRSRQR